MSLRRFFLFVTLFPLVDFALLVWFAVAVSWQWAFVWVAATAMLGSWLIPRSSRNGDLVSMFAGVLLVLPGAVGDLLGLLLLIRPLRRAFLRRLADYVVDNMIVMLAAAGQATHRPSRPAKIIDVHVVDPEPPEPRSR